MVCSAAIWLLEACICYRQLPTHLNQEVFGLNLPWKHSARQSKEDKAESCIENHL